MTTKPCVTCKFHKKASWLSVRGDICTNEKCEEKAWTYTDQVTGRKHHYERRHAECFAARISSCIDGVFWASKDGVSAKQNNRQPHHHDEKPISVNPQSWTGRA